MASPSRTAGLSAALLLGLLGCPGEDPKTERAPAFEELAPAEDSKQPVTDPAPEEDPRAKVYADAMEAMADEVIAKTKAGAATDFHSYEEAQTALEAALPQRSLSKIDDALIDASITAEDMAAFMRDNPEYVQQVGARFSERLAEVEPELAKLIAKVAAVAPPEDKDKVREQLEGLGYGGLLDAPTWNDVIDAASLAELAQKAASEDKPLLIDVWASWCAPCRDLEDKTLSDPEVQKTLRDSFVLAKLDATEPAPPAERLQTLLGAATLPAVLAWKDSKSLARALAADKPAPKPALEIRVFVEPTELLPRLRKL